MSLDKIAALYLAKARFQNKKKVKTQDGDDMTVYEYSDAQVARRNSDKAKRVQKLRSMRTSLVKQVKKDMKSSDTLTQLKALAVALIDHTYERVGNEQSAKEGHKGVTGWQKKDIKFLKGKARIKYVGKSGVHQTKFVTDAGALSLLKELCKGKKPSAKLLEKDDATVTAEDVNDYLPEGITAKDLRGLHANEEMREALKAQRAKGPDLPKDRKAKGKILKDEFKKALEESAEAVGHEPATLRSQYLVPNMEKVFMQDGSVIDKLDKKATKSQGENEDEGDRKMLRKDPKYKPPRYDLRNNKTFDKDTDKDPDFDDEASADKDKDLSRNFKRVAMRWAANMAKSEDGAKKLHEDYVKENPGSDKKWQDFFEKPDDKKKEDDAPEDKKPSPEEEQKAQIKQTVNDVKTELAQSFKGKLPTTLKGGLSEALAEMTPEQMQTFNSSLKNYSNTAQSLPADTPKAVTRAERSLEDLDHIDFGELSSPEELAQKLVEYSHAKSVLDSNRAKQKGRSRKVTDAVVSLEEQLAKGMGNDKYVIPSKIKKPLKEKLDSLTDEDFDEMVKSISEQFDGLGDEYDAEDSGDAKAILEDLEDNLEGETNVDSASAQIAHALAAQRILERHDQKQKDGQKATKGAIRGVAKAFGQKKLPSEVEGKLSKALEAMSLEEKQMFLEEVSNAQQLLQGQIEKTDDGKTFIPPKLIAQSAEAMSKDKFEGKPSEIARDVALAMAAQTMVADPFNLDDQPVSSERKTLSELTGRGMRSYEKYKELPQEMRAKAAESVNERLGQVDPDSPEADELNRILDGIALAAVSDDRLKELPRIPGREMNPAFAQLARALVKRGDIATLLGPVEDMTSNRGQLAVARAMDSMEDGALAEATRDSMPELADFLTGDTKLDPERRAVLRSAIIDTHVDNMALVDELVKSRMKSSGDDRWEDAEYRADVAKRASKLNPKKAIQGFLDWISKPKSGTQLLEQQYKLAHTMCKVADTDFPMEIRKENLEAVDRFTKKEFGQSKGHHETALSRFFETGDVGFLRADPKNPEPEIETEDFAKKSGVEPRFSLDNWDVLMAGQLSVRAGTSVFLPQRGNNMPNTLTKEAATQVTGLLDRVASTIQKNHRAFGIPEKIAFDFATRCDLLSDEIDRQSPSAKSAADDNKSLPPNQRYNPAEIGKQDATPPQTEPDEAYMKKNFIQEEFNELRHFQQDGLFSNSKAASVTAKNMIAKLQGMLSVLEAE